VRCDTVVIYERYVIHLFNSEVALKWDSNNVKVILEMSPIEISAHRSLFLMKVQIFFTACSKCLDTGII
jgi:hypothetical protein